MQMDYSKVNQTTFTTHGMDGDYNKTGDNQVITYQFDNFGHPVAVQDQDGNANKYQYDTDDEKRAPQANEGELHAEACAQSAGRL